MFQTEAKQSLTALIGLKFFKKNRIVANKTKSGLSGVMDSNLNPIVAFKYYDIIILTDWLAAVLRKGNTYWIDFLDSECRLVKSIQIGEFECNKTR